MTRTSENPAAANFRELRKGEVRRIPLLRGWANKGIKKGRGLGRPSPNGKAVPSLPLLFLVLLLLREEDVADGDVHLGDSQTNQVLDPSYDVPAHTLSYLGMILPYSTLMLRSTAASTSPTSTETPRI